ncbi:murein hydrolase activator EnvC family protein [Alteromonas oceanisediminis]|uniref:murein hydrolase activator EnvC family protein n=1 Tax=Alteromonas oceanisediminis TaxID=2836180 RepID=UPI001BDA986D|nr:peptidoglycan DD-metalloendopeptidase family protein [Alteromonas oceanisediminis]MBT0586063.1 peptidoglycan DD-metalloendopeptidase family protein [Alteromonas oceanisediminis]
MRLIRSALLCLIWFLLVPVGLAQQDDELKELQAEIKQTQAQIAKNKAAADKLENALKQAEIAISSTARQLAETQRSLEDNRAEQRKLATQQVTLETRIRQQQAQLAAQVKSAYMAGNYDYAKMLLNQENPSTFERVLTYYQYVSDARRDAIAKFRADVEELERVKATLAQRIEELNQLLSQQKTQRAELSAQQSQRQRTLDELNTAIQTDGERVAQLQASAEALVRAIEQARIEAQRKPTQLDGLSGAKGQLTMPAEGRFRRLFGDRRQGEVRWTGVIIEGDEGSAVRAVYQGRVLYADWLKGFGLVTILDHGDGYMSVYGHSQALLTQPGDTVTAGQTIGLVGRSGGQASPNLYFEIRHKGKALNPSAWLAWR